MRLPAPSRKIIVKPLLVSDKPEAVVAFITWAQPKIGSEGLKLPPPNTTMASPAGREVPDGKVNRVVSVTLPIGRVRIVQLLRLINSLEVPLTSSINSS